MNPRSRKSPQNIEWQAPCICWQAPELETDSSHRGASLNLPQCQTINDDQTWVLSADAHGLYLKTDNNLILRSSFGRDNAELRAAQSGFINDTFAKAIGVARLQKMSSHHPSIIDATGGLGQDAMTLVSLGCHVTVVERHPILHCLLADMMIGERNARLVNEDASDTLSEIAVSGNADVIYLDPMYPERRRRGMSKKGMQVLHELLGPNDNNDDDNDNLLHSALEACRACDGFRVVVKRPYGATPLLGHDDWKGQITCVESPNTRYDIYHHRPIA